MLEMDIRFLGETKGILKTSKNMPLGEIQKLSMENRKKTERLLSKEEHVQTHLNNK